MSSPTGARPTGKRKAAAPAQPARDQAAAEKHDAADKYDVAEKQAAGEEQAAGEGVPRPSWAGWDGLLRVVGVVVSLIAAFVTGALELLLTTMRAGDLISVWRGDSIGSGGGPLIGVSVLLAIAANLGIAWFAVTSTGRRWALGPPWALWTLLMFIAAGVRTAEGDYLLSGTDYIAVAMILIGSLAYAIFAYRMILKRIPTAHRN
jgi:hypothetical protein